MHDGDDEAAFCLLLKGNILDTYTKQALYDQLDIENYIFALGYQIIHLDEDLTF